MLSLSYSACYDPYNTIFRMLAILNGSMGKAMDVDALRIADFFVCFPARLPEVRPPNFIKGMRGRRNAIIRELRYSEYELLPSSVVLFERMEVIQETAISAMVSKCLIALDQGNGHRKVKLEIGKMPEPLATKVQQFSVRNNALVNFVAKDMAQISISGPDGLKARTGLREFLYDAI